ncbi:MAG: Spy0128 family protein [Streptococcus salivarius]
MTESSAAFVVTSPVNVNFTKALAGRTLVAGEFTFEMKDENGVVVATGTNDEHGVVTFNQLPEVKNAQVGKVIKYKVTEKVPANKEFGVTYDNMVAEVSVTVSKMQIYFESNGKVSRRHRVQQRCNPTNRLGLTREFIVSKRNLTSLYSS